MDSPPAHRRAVSQPPPWGAHPPAGDSALVDRWDAEGHRIEAEVQVRSSQAASQAARMWRWRWAQICRNPGVLEKDAKTK